MLVVIGAVVLVVLTVLTFLIIDYRRSPESARQGAQEFVDSLNAADFARVKQLTCGRAQEHWFIRGEKAIRGLTFSLGKVEQLSETTAMADLPVRLKFGPSDTSNPTIALVKEDGDWKFCGFAREWLR